MVSPFAEMAAREKKSPFADLAAPAEEQGVDIQLSISPKGAAPKRSPFADLAATAGGRTTAEMLEIEGGGLKAPGEYTGSWWKDIIPSLFDPGVWMDPSNILAGLGTRA